MRPAWGFRAARAAMFAAICVLLAALGHALMSGTPIPGWALVTSFAGVGTAAWFVADRERGVPFVVLGTLAAQTTLHLWFSAAQAQRHPQSPSDPHAMHMAHHTMPMAADTAHGHHSMQAAAETSVDHLAGMGSFGMLAAHLLATLLCGFWLAYGERAAFAILRTAARRLLIPLRLISGPRVTVYQPNVRPHRSPSTLRPFLLVHAITSRGPPRGVAVI